MKCVKLCEIKLLHLIHAPLLLYVDHVLFRFDVISYLISNWKIMKRFSKNTHIRINIGITKKIKIDSRSIRVKLGKWISRGACMRCSDSTLHSFTYPPFPFGIFYDVLHFGLKCLYTNIWWSFFEKNDFVQPDHIFCNKIFIQYLFW